MSVPQRVCQALAYAACLGSTAWRSTNDGAGGVGGYEARAATGANRAGSSAGF